MRLTTLARKINKTPSQLITFLEENGVKLPNGLHTRLEESKVEMVMKHFLPEEEVSIPIEPEKGTGVDVIEKSKPEKEDPGEFVTSANPSETENMDEQDKVAEIQENSDTIKTGTVEDLESELSEEIELIRPKKIKLEGIKVIGKIELPEIPKKEDKKSETTTEQDWSADEKIENPLKTSTSKPRKFEKKGKRHKSGRNRKPLTYEEKLKQEEREKLRKRRQKENEEKRKKKQYYEQNIQPKIASVSRKKKKKKSQSTAVSTQKKNVVHKNPLKRFWAWLNGQYDHY